MNIRKTANMDLNYCQICRTELNYSAILYAALCRRENASRFLELCGLSANVGPDFGVYFEYSYLRDLWNKLESNSSKRDIIKSHLRVDGLGDTLLRPTEDVNRYFGVRGNQPSSETLQSPASWSISKYDKHFSSNDDFLKVCRFKWSFNIKPDIVIHRDKNTAVCIEAKCESKESRYPSGSADRNVFKRRKIPYQGQSELQQYMMTELLGLETHFVLLLPKGTVKSDTHKIVTWAQAFGALDLTDLPSYARQMAASVPGERKPKTSVQPIP